MNDMVRPWGGPPTNVREVTNMNTPMAESD